jgi:hypothetical protein
MSRLAFFLCASITGLTGWLFLEHKRATRHVPARDAAAMLAQAWADHHTRA